MNRGYYAIIPANVRYDKDLTANAKLLYGEITALCNEKGYCWATNQYFADLYGASTKSISRWIGQLVDKGYIKSQLAYKEGSKEIQERRLYIASPMDKIVQGGGQNCHEGMDKNVQDNNTVNNTNNKYIEQAEKLWQLYPNKKGKTRAIMDIKRHLKNYTYEQLENAVKAYAAEVAGRDKQYIKHGSTFFKDGILDYLEADGPEKEEPRDAAINEADEEYFTRLMMEQLNPENKL